MKLLIKRLIRKILNTLDLQNIDDKLLININWNYIKIKTLVWLLGRQSQT